MAPARNRKMPVFQKRLPSAKYFFRGLQIRLFDKARHVEDAGTPAGDLDIAIARLRLGRLDAEDDEPPGICCGDALLDGLPELPIGRNLVVGGNDQHDIVAVGGQRLQRRKRHGGGRVAADGSNIAPPPARSIAARSE